MRRNVTNPLKLEFTFPENEFRSIQYCYKIQQKKIVKTEPPQKVEMAMYMCG